MAKEKKDVFHEAAQSVLPPLPNNWPTMTGDEKFQYFVAHWSSTAGKSFASNQMAEKYERHTKRWLDVVSLRQPDRVPNIMMADGFILNHSGIQPADWCYDAKKTADALYHFAADFDCDHSVDLIPMVGKAFDLLGYKLIRWPGSSLAGALPDDTQFQYIEKEYMYADEYDELIANPEGFLLLKYLPRIFDGLNEFSRVLKDFPTLYNLVQANGVSILLEPFSKAPLRNMVKSLVHTLFKAADHTSEYLNTLAASVRKIRFDFGLPSLFGALAFAPFDLIGDTLRGTTGVMLDMHRNPDQLIAACRALVPTAIKMAVQTVMTTRTPFVLIPLHKGDDGFMSPEQFETFYWPSFNAQLLGLIDAGLVPIPFVEGAYNHRLDTIAQSGLPAGKTVWLFDRTDMKAAKEKLGSFACIGGNVPAALFSLAASPQKMEAYCKNLIETAAPGGGFIMSPGSVVAHAEPKNVHAFFASAKKYGMYS